MPLIGKSVVSARGLCLPAWLPRPGAKLIRRGLTRRVGAVENDLLNENIRPKSCADYAILL
jgi:hypothetical protein